MKYALLVLHATVASASKVGILGEKLVLGGGYFEAHVRRRSATSNLTPSERLVERRQCDVDVYKSGPRTIAWGRAVGSFSA